MSKKETKQSDLPQYTGNDFLERKRRLQAVGHLKPTNLKTAKFVYAVERNLIRLEPIIKSIQKSQKEPNEDYIKYQNKRYQLGQECGGKERRLPNGSSELIDIEDKVRFGRGLKALNDEYATAIEVQDEINRFNEKALNEVVEEPIEWYMTDYINTPAEVSAQQRADLNFMLREPKEEDFEQMEMISSGERE